MPFQKLNMAAPKSPRRRHEQAHEPYSPPTLPAPVATADAKVFHEGDQQVQVVGLTAESGMTAEILPTVSGTVRSWGDNQGGILLYPPGKYTFTRGIPAPFFPFGGRIVGTKVMINCEVRDLEQFLDNVQMRMNGEGNPLHGLQFSWKVESATVTQDPTGRKGATVTLTYDADTNPIFHKMFDQGDKKASAKLRLTYTIIGDELTIKYSIKNDGQTDIPNYTNIHPWINTDGKPVKVSLPTATKRIIYKNHVRVGDEPATGQYDFKTPKKIDVAYEEVFEVEGDANHKATSTLILPDGTEIQTTQDVRQFKYVKVWINPDLKVASLQPLSDNIGSFTKTKEPTCDIIRPDKDQDREWEVKMKIIRPKPEMLRLEAGELPSRYPNLDVISPELVPWASENVLFYFEAVRDRIPEREYELYGRTKESVADLIGRLVSGKEAGVDEFERTANVFEPYRYGSDESSITCNRLLAAMFILQGEHKPGDMSIARYVNECLIRSGDIKQNSQP